uniref:ICP4 n=1 Tax=Gallid alphaherpesvirus 3 TaxID=35250 RepID=A0A5J6NIJ2_9ALPH|nr:ICP4 [Gallid alphaherpesvirus 3]QEY02211.1 ICP4 [Gallid alphaherpesvirus 3]
MENPPDFYSLLEMLADNGGFSPQPPATPGDPYQDVCLNTPSVAVPPTPGRQPVPPRSKSPARAAPVAGSLAGARAPFGIEGAVSEGSDTGLRSAEPPDGAHQGSPGEVVSSTADIVDVCGNETAAAAPRSCSWQKTVGDLVPAGSERGEPSPMDPRKSNDPVRCVSDAPCKPTGACTPLAVCVETLPPPSGVPPPPPPEPIVNFPWTFSPLTPGPFAQHHSPTPPTPPPLSPPPPTPPPLSPPPPTPPPLSLPPPTPPPHTPPPHGSPPPTPLPSTSPPSTQTSSPSASLPLDSPPASTPPPPTPLHDRPLSPDPPALSASCQRPSPPLSPSAPRLAPAPLRSDRVPARRKSSVSEGGGPRTRGAGFQYVCRLSASARIPSPPREELELVARQPGSHAMLWRAGARDGATEPSSGDNPKVFLLALSDARRCPSYWDRLAREAVLREILPTPRGSPLRTSPGSIELPREAPLLDSDYRPFEWRCAKGRPLPQEPVFPCPPNELGNDWAACKMWLFSRCARLVLSTLDDMSPSEDGESVLESQGCGWGPQNECPLPLPAPIVLPTRIWEAVTRLPRPAPRTPTYAYILSALLRFLGLQVTPDFVSKVPRLSYRWLDRLRCVRRVQYMAHVLTRDFSYQLQAARGLPCFPACAPPPGAGTPLDEDWNGTPPSESPRGLDCSRRRGGFYASNFCPLLEEIRWVEGREGSPNPWTGLTWNDFKMLHYRCLFFKVRRGLLLAPDDYIVGPDVRPGFEVPFEMPPPPATALPPALSAAVRESKLALRNGNPEPGGTPHGSRPARAYGFMVQQLAVAMVELGFPACGPAIEKRVRPLYKAILDWRAAVTAAALRRFRHLRQPSGARDDGAPMFPPLPVPDWNGPSPRPGLVSSPTGTQERYRRVQPGSGSDGSHTTAPPAVLKQALQQEVGTPATRASHPLPRPPPASYPSLGCRSRSSSSSSASSSSSSSSSAPSSSEQSSAAPSSRTSSRSPTREAGAPQCAARGRGRGRGGRRGRGRRAPSPSSETAAPPPPDDLDQEVWWQIPSPPAGRCWFGPLGGHRQALRGIPEVEQAAVRFLSTPGPLPVYVEEMGNCAKQYEALVSAMLNKDVKANPLNWAHHGKLSPTDAALNHIYVTKFQSSHSSPGAAVTGTVNKCIPHIASAMKKRNLLWALPHIAASVSMTRRYCKDQKEFMFRSLRKAYAPMASAASAEMRRPSASPISNRAPVTAQSTAAGLIPVIDVSTIHDRVRRGVAAFNSALEEGLLDVPEYRLVAPARPDIPAGDGFASTRPLNELVDACALECEGVVAALLRGPDGPGAVAEMLSSCEDGPFPRPAGHEQWEKCRALLGSWLRDLLDLRSAVYAAYANGSAPRGRQERTLAANAVALITEAIGPLLSKDPARPWRCPGSRDITSVLLRECGSRGEPVRSREKARRLQRVARLLADADAASSGTSEGRSRSAEPCYDPGPASSPEPVRALCAQTSAESRKRKSAPAAVLDGADNAVENPRPRLGRSRTGAGPPPVASCTRPPTPPEACRDAGPFPPKRPRCFPWRDPARIMDGSLSLGDRRHRGAAFRKPPIGTPIAGYAGPPHLDAYCPGEGVDELTSFAQIPTLWRQPLARSPEAMAEIARVASTPSHVSRSPDTAASEGVLCRTAVVSLRARTAWMRHQQASPEDVALVILYTANPGEHLFCVPAPGSPPGGPRFDPNRGGLSFLLAALANRLCLPESAAWAGRWRAAPDVSALTAAGVMFLSPQDLGFAGVLEHLQRLCLKREKRLVVLDTLEDQDRPENGPRLVEEAVRYVRCTVSPRSQCSVRWPGHPDLATTVITSRDVLGPVVLRELETHFRRENPAAGDISLCCGSNVRYKVATRLDRVATVPMTALSYLAASSALVAGRQRPPGPDFLAGESHSHRAALKWGLYAPLRPVYVLEPKKNAIVSPDFLNRTVCDVCRSVVLPPDPHAQPVVVHVPEATCSLLAREMLAHLCSSSVVWLEGDGGPPETTVQEEQGARQRIIHPPTLPGPPSPLALSDSEVFGE